MEEDELYYSPEAIAAFLDEASRKYVFSTYKVFSFLAQAQTVDKLKQLSLQFRDEAGMLIHDLLSIHQVVDPQDRSSDDLSRIIDMTIDFTRLFHLSEILCLSDSTTSYINVILWLQASLMNAFF